MNKRIIRKIVLAGLTLGSLAAGFFIAIVWLNSIFFGPFKSGPQPKVPFLVERGWSVSTVSEELFKQGITRNTWVVKALGKLKKLPEILSGEYLLSSDMTPREVLQKFINKELVYHDLVLPEGLNIQQIKELMVKTTVVTANDAERALNDKSLLSKLKIPSTTLEGYLFPNTYRFSRPDTAEMFVMAMYREGEKRKTKEADDQARAIGMTWHQILTLASIIEKESGNNDPEERKKISSVFHNRLRIKMPLQSDPTVIYGIPEFGGNLTRADLQTPTAYNTYLIDGLPPTPICSPGDQALTAALHPADTDFLYFVSKGDGASQFSATYDEHRDAVNKFQVEPAKASQADKVSLPAKDSQADKVIPSAKARPPAKQVNEDDLNAILGDVQ